MAAWEYPTQFFFPQARRLAALHVVEKIGSRPNSSRGVCFLAS